jgi:nitric oxide reductase subunit B
MTKPSEHAAIVAIGRRVARGYLGMAGALLLAALVVGLLVGLHYTPLAASLNASGLRLSALRPMHTSASAGWIFFGGMAMVYRWMFEHLATRAAAGEAGVSQLVFAIARRAVIQRWLWAITGLAAATSLLAGYTTGREYVEYPPILGVPIVAGWLLYGVNFAVVTRFRLREMPVYAWMWATSLFLFLWTFAEANAYLLEALASRPVRDLAIQWKSAGSLIGSFNMLVYGSIAWLGTRLSGDESYARSNTAFLLFLVGTLNSFTNYGHHTYHLPQSELVKWIAFIISMTEALILARVVYDCSGLGRKWAGRGRYPLASALLVATTVWTGMQIAVAIVYSVPFLNAYVHGTLAVVAHSMGTLIGIDTMALLAAGAWLAREPAGETAGSTRSGLVAVVAFNAGLTVLWVVLLAVGVPAGIRLVNTGVLPWIGAFPAWLGPAMLGAGAVMTVAILVLVRPMLAAGLSSRVNAVDTPR